jgi:hypothetical protein
MKPLRAFALILFFATLTPALAHAAWQRTLVFMYGQTVVGQDMFLRGGIDWDYAKNNLNRNCSADKWLCAIPIQHNLFKQDPNRVNDTFIDWYGPQLPGQSASTQGSPLVWTTNNPNHAYKVATHGYGYTPLNTWGDHYWLLDVNMDCDQTVNGWFELKTYISNGPGWENNIRQPGAPYTSNNHFAKCGMLNMFKRGENTALISTIPTDTTSSTCTPATAPPSGSGRTIYVATNGNDSSGDGSLAKPFASLKRASELAGAGDTVTVRGGTYRLSGEQYLQSRGTASAWVRFRPADGEQVVIDGTNASLPDLYRGLLTLGGAYMLFEGFEIINSPGSGLKFYQANNLFIRNNRIHDVKGVAIGGSANYVTIQNNEVYNAVMSNQYGARDTGSGWLQGISSAYFDTPNTRSTDWLIENNDVHDVWGECIDAMYLNNGVIRGNRVRDCFSTNLYSDNAYNITFDRNYVYVTSDRYNTVVNPHRAHGITFAFESRDRGVGCSNNRCIMDTLRITNNIIAGTHNGILYFDTQNGGYKNITLAHNVIFDQRREAIWIAGSANASGTNKIHNNILFKGHYAGALGIGNMSNWIFGNNNWPQQNVPSFDPNGTNADPQLLSTVTGGAAEGFKIAHNSPLVSAGKPLSEVGNDYWCRGRHIYTPSIGAHEVPHL